MITIKSTYDLTGKPCHFVYKYGVVIYDFDAYAPGLCQVHEMHDRYTFSRDDNRTVCYMSKKSINEKDKLWIQDAYYEDQ